METITHKQRRIIVTILISGAFFASLSQSLLTSALPSIIKEFTISASVGQWLTSAYILTIGIVCTFTAYLINKFDVKHLFIGSTFVFFSGCVLAYFSPNFITLLLSRLLQALGTGVILTLIQVEMLYLYPQEEHGKSLTYIGFVVGFAPSIGPTLSGILVDTSGWRSIFILLIVASFIVMVLACFFLENVGERYPAKMDFLSAIIIGLGIVLLMISITNLTTNGLDLLSVILPLILGILMIIYFIHRQLNSKIPLLNVRVFKNRKFLLVNLIIYIAALCWMSGYLLVPLFIQSALGLSATISGLLMLPANLCYASLNPAGGRFYDNYGGKWTAIIGCLFLLFGSLPFVFFNKNTNILLISFSYILRLIGLVFTIMPLFAYALSDLPRKDYAHGNAIINANRQIFGALGTTVLVAFVTVSSTVGNVSVKGINGGFFIQVILLIFALLISIFIIKDDVKD
jgi:EmrB/QacA subfamily drug resistance transporter